MGADVKFNNSAQLWIGNTFMKVRLLTDLTEEIKCSSENNMYTVIRKVKNIKVSTY